MRPDTSRPWTLAGAQLHTESGVWPGGGLSITDGTIGDLHRCHDETADTLMLPPDWHVVPGFIDSHIHGAAGADVMDASADALVKLSRALPGEGTTSFLATTMTAPAPAIAAAMHVLGAFTAPDDGAEMLGVHLEGPFISPQRLGAQSPHGLAAPNVEHFRQWQALAGNRIAVVTLAPELAGADALMQAVRTSGARVSIGHTDCSAAFAERAIAAGCDRATHLFNAMSGLHHRTPGAACAVLAAPACRAEIIADGVHVAPEMLRLAYRAKGAHGLIAITDAMRAKGLADGVYDLGGQRVTVCEGAARLDDGTLAGSVLRLDQGLRNMLAACDCTLTEALAMVSRNPAADLGVADRKGTLAPGKDADIVVLDADLRVRLTICRGRIVHDALPWA